MSLYDDERRDAIYGYQGFIKKNSFASKLNIALILLGVVISVILFGIFEKATETSREVEEQRRTIEMLEKDIEKQEGEIEELKQRLNKFIESRNNLTLRDESEGKKE